MLTWLMIKSDLTTQCITVKFSVTENPVIHSVWNDVYVMNKKYLLMVRSLIINESVNLEHGNKTETPSVSKASRVSKHKV